MENQSVDERRNEIDFKLLCLEYKEKKILLYFEIIKYIVFIFGSIFIFFIIQRPESILNRASSKDSISRERAKLILEWIKEDDPQKRADAFTVIKGAYGDIDNQWVKRIETLLEKNAKQEALNKSLLKYIDLVNKRADLIAEREQKLRFEFQRSDYPGMGPQYRQIEESYSPKINKINSEIESLKDALDKDGITIPFFEEKSSR